MRTLLGRIAVLLTLACAGCATAASGPGAGSRRADRDVITQAAIREAGYRNALEAVRALRSNWLQTKGTDSFGSPTQVQVYHDGDRLGGIETLRWIPTSDITYIRYFDGVNASARWGLDHGQGVIFVSSRPLATRADSTGGG